MTGECTWNAPCLGTACLHQPQDYVVALENNLTYYVKWSLSKNIPHIRTWAKPPGYLRCSRCLKNLALLRCTSLPGAFCFYCFQATFAAEDFVHDTSTLCRVHPIGCDVCKHGKLASWRCAEDDNKFSSLAACASCFRRMAPNNKWLRL